MPCLISVAGRHASGRLVLAHYLGYTPYNRAEYSCAVSHFGEAFGIRSGYTVGFYVGSRQPAKRPLPEHVFRIPAECYEGKFWVQPPGDEAPSLVSLEEVKRLAKSKKIAHAYPENGNTWVPLGELGIAIS